MSKPMGAIPPGFEAQDGVLAIGGRRADVLVEQAGGTPLFVYDFGIVRRQVERFRSAFRSVNLHYAIKANTYNGILENISKLVDGLDVASEGEMRAALASGAEAADISFAGPGKRDPDLADAINEGITLNAESEGEVERALAIGAKLGRRP